MTRYASGRRAEWRARDLFKNRGCDVVRSAGSKGLIDLVALCPADVVLIQVKYTKSGHWSDKNWEALMALAAANRFPYARVVAVVYEHGVKEPKFFWAGGQLQ